MIKTTIGIKIKIVDVQFFFINRNRLTNIHNLLLECPIHQKSLLRVKFIFSPIFSPLPLHFEIQKQNNGHSFYLMNDGN